MLVGKACANLQEESHLYNPHARLSVKWLQSKTPQRIHLQRKWLQKHLYESYLHGLKQMEGNKLQEERRQGAVLSPRLMSNRISTSPCTTHFYNFIFTWGDGTGCAVHTGCVCCGQCHCWSYNRVCFVLTSSVGHFPSWDPDHSLPGAAENRP